MTSPPLIAETDPPAVEFCHERGQTPVLLTCDHASRRVPKALDNLGLPDELLARHIGWDIGAAEATRRLAPLLDAPAILAGYSRLVIDCNRRPEDSSLIPRESDGVAIPGNANLSASERGARREAIFDPYHGAIAAWIAAKRAHGIAPAVISIHSFTPVMKGVPRPWHVGVLWDGQGRIALPLLTALRAEPGLVVGDNEPYSAREPVGYTQRHHAFEAGLPHVAIELRQDLVADAQGAALWAERLARALKPILARNELYVAIAPPPPHS
jgi:predicted N-formylglutamate amidohydrolase